MDTGIVSQAIETALAADGYGTPEVRRDIAFHMTDWLSDLERLYDYCKAPDALTTDETVELLTGFLIHVPNHLAAASKLLTGIPVTDVFDVGATCENEGSQAD